jgi:hypothetical protein
MDLCPSCRDDILVFLGMLSPHLGGLFAREEGAEEGRPEKMSHDATFSPPVVAETKPAVAAFQATAPVAEKTPSPYNVTLVPKPALPAPKPASGCEAKHLRRAIAELIRSKGVHDLVGVVQALDPREDCEAEIMLTLQSMVDDGTLRYVPGVRKGSRAYDLVEVKAAPKPKPMPVMAGATR